MLLSALVYIFLFPVATVKVEDTETIYMDDKKYTVSTANVYKEKLSDSHMTILGFTLNKTKLRDVQSKLGKAKLIPSREGEPISICYISDNDDDQTTLIFHAWDTDTSLLSFDLLSSQTNFTNREKCLKSHLVSKKIVTNGGLRLGLSMGELKSILGKPTKEEGNNLFYFYRTKQVMTEQEIKEIRKDKIPASQQEDFYWDVESRIEAIFQENKLIAITISKTVTY